VGQKAPQHSNPIALSASYGMGWDKFAWENISIFCDGSVNAEKYV